MSSPRGYVLHLAPKRLETLRDCVELEQVFAEPVAKFQHSRAVPMVCFVIDEGQLLYLAIAKRGQNAGTELSRLNLSHVVALEIPLALEDIVRELPERARQYAGTKFRDGGLLTRKAFLAVVEVLRRLSSSANKFLARFRESEDGENC